MAKIFIDLDEGLINDIREYCELNSLDVHEFIGELLKRAFTIEKYGDAPPFFKRNENKLIETVVVPAKEENTRETVKDKSPAEEKETTETVVLSKIDGGLPEKAEESKVQKKTNPRKEQAKKKIEYL